MARGCKLMDKKKKTGLAFAALAAAPVAAVALPAVQTPSFNCDAASGGGTINWGDGLALVPYVGTASGELTKQTVVVPLSCADGAFQESVKLTTGLMLGFSYQAGPTGDEFKILSTADVSNGADKYSYFNVALESPDSKISPSTGLDFLGIKLDSTDSFLDLGGLSAGTGSGPVGFDIETLKSFDTTSGKSGFGSFDSPSTPTEVTVSLYSTPFVPSSVPEPGTLGLLGTGLFGLAMRWRLRKK